MDWPDGRRPESSTHLLIRGRAFPLLSDSMSNMVWMKQREKFKDEPKEPVRQPVEGHVGWLLFALCLSQTLAQGLTSEVCVVVTPISVDLSAFPLLLEGDIMLPGGSTGRQCSATFLQIQ